MRKLAIFDSDGTLVDTENTMWPFIHKKCLNALGYDAPQELRSKIKGHNRYDIMDILRSYYKDFPCEEFFNMVNDEIINYINNEKIEAMPGVVEILEHLKSKGITCCVASSAITERLIGILDNANILPYFDKLFGGADTKRGKPAPDIYLHVLNYYGLKKEECIIFEDSHNGAQAAINSGIDLVLVPNDVYLKEEDYKGAYKIYKQIDEAIELF